jgi:hypothetical protein
MYHLKKVIKMAAKILSFPTDKVRGFETRNQDSIFSLFPREEAQDFIKYHETALEWKQTIKPGTIYSGYPIEPPCKPFREDMIWYTDEKKQFGVWIINQSDKEVILNENIEFGWSPFIRRSTAPPHEPVHIQTVEMRKQLVWIVDEDGYGQYGMITKNEKTIWVPNKRPKDWQSQ